MPLHPDVERLLAVFAASDQPKIWEITPAEAREGTMALARAVDVKDVPIGKIENGTLPGPASALPWRSYTPETATAAVLPGLVYFHGGGYVVGNLDSHDGLCRMLANASGCRVVSIDYRLAPEHPFPAAIEDGLAATRFIAAHAAEFGIDPSRLAVGGDSAGGNLTAVVCQEAKRLGGPKIALQLLLCPGLDWNSDTPSRREFADGYFLERRSMDWFGRHYRGENPDPDDPKSAPLRAKDVSGLPPAHIHTAECDPLRDEGMLYGERLTAAGVAVRYTCHAGMIHHFYCMAQAIPYGRIAIAAAGDAVRQALAPS